MRCQRTGWDKHKTVWRMPMVFRRYPVRLIQYGVIFVLGVFIFGCSCPGYCLDRKRDMLDVFSATVGEGVGVKVRVGPITPALICNSNWAGLLGGDCFCGYDESLHDPRTSNGFESIILLGGDSGNPSPLTYRRHKYYKAFVCLGLAMPDAFDGTPEYNASYYTQIEAVVGLGGTIRLGFNPGELLDFLLGWFGVDIYNDDLEAQKIKIEMLEPEIQKTNTTNNP